MSKHVIHRNKKRALVKREMQRIVAGGRSRFFPNYTAVAAQEALDQMAVQDLKAAGMMGSLANPPHPWGVTMIGRRGEQPIVRVNRGRVLQGLRGPLTPATAALLARRDLRASQYLRRSGTAGSLAAAARAVRNDDRELAYLRRSGTAGSLAEMAILASRGRMSGCGNNHDSGLAREAGGRDKI
jgi:hypothetical protein